MGAKAVQISLDDALLRRIDADPDVQRRGRSAVIREALELYLRVRDRRRIDREIRAAYGGEGEAMQSEIGDLLGTQKWPDA